MPQRDSQEPAWTGENSYREAGETTFQSCGWCVHRGIGTYRYNCMIEGNCSLMPDYDKDSAVRWDTPCRIARLGRADLLELIGYQTYKADEHRKGIQRAETLAKVLRDCAASADPEMPPLRWNRRHDHFNIGDRIWFFCDGRWRPNTCVPGYRHHDGCVSGVEDGTAKDTGCGIASPTVLLDREFRYFADSAHTRQWETWQRAVEARDYNGHLLMTLRPAILAGEGDAGGPRPVLQQ